ncbi:FKBP-type peptidyl-prolyl cis-trans isomerase [Hyphomonas sp.]|uniref:FKBP-type peptidyl-prolyl cis-trans isomerase n=1 Tax=Hyphomonas sp. TaxID=87 RepID=UPI003919E919
MVRLFTAASALALVLAACAPNPVTAPANGSQQQAASPGQEEDMNMAADPGVAKAFSDNPSPEDRVRVHYEGRLPSGEKFDSSFDRGTPAEFRLNQVIPGWTLGLQQMAPGDSFLFYIPNRLAYGNQARGPFIKAGDDLVFYVSLLGTVAPKVSDTAAWERLSPWDSSNPDVVKTGSGLEYVVLKSGDPAGPTPRGEQYVSVHYEGRLAANGSMFDSSYERGEPAAFPANRLIPGWVEALQLMRPGDHWMLYIPAELAYGPGGTPDGVIPPGAALQFEVELLEIYR